jgi:hypothetical protein
LQVLEKFELKLNKNKLKSLPEFKRSVHLKQFILEVEENKIEYIEGFLYELAELDKLEKLKLKINKNRIK